MDLEALRSALGLKFALCESIVGTHLIIKLYFMFRVLFLNDNDI